MSEIALVSSKKTRLELAKQRGDKNAKLALDLANSPEKFLSTVQIGITLIGILTGVFSGENITEDLEAFYAQYELLQPYYETLATTSVVILITFFSLVIGELVPKRIGLSNPEGIAKTVAGPMKVLSKIVAPFVWLLSISGNLLIKLFGIKPVSQQQVTEEEIKAMVQEGAHAGVIREIEQDIVERVFHLGDRRAITLMTPRQEIDWLNVHDTREENLAKIIANNHTVYPLCDEELDKVIGVIHIKDVLTALEKGETVDFMKLKRDVLFLPEMVKSYRVLEKFKESRKHYAIVVDEYGGVSGIITMNDIMDALVGDMPEGDDTAYQIVEREDGTFLIDAQLPIEEFMSYFDLEIPREEYSAFHTLAGLAMFNLKRIPKAGDVFDWIGFKFEVMDMDGNRVDKMLITKPVSEQ